MNEKAEILFDAVTSIRPELVERALDAPIRRRPVWRRYAALCACLALAVCVGWFALLSGGMGGGSDMISTDSAPADNSAPPPAIPEDVPQLPGAPSEDGGEMDGAPIASFTAQVAEVRESTLLVRPDDPWDAETVEVSLEGLETLPALAPGDRVRVTFAGEVQEDGLITGVTEIAAVP